MFLGYWKYQLDIDNSIVVHANLEWARECLQAHPNRYQSCDEDPIALCLATFTISFIDYPCILVDIDHIYFCTILLICLHSHILTDYFA